MSYNISRLGAKDFEEAIDFINLVFSISHQPTDFVKLLPAYYKPADEQMKCHYVIKIDGKIRALVGVYPGEIKVGNRTLKAARIGAVSTHPNFMGHGMMQELMNYCVNMIKQEGYDIGLLGGLRNRYLYFGYEKCGYKMVYMVNKSNIKHSGIKVEDIEIKPILKEDRNLIQYYISLHDKQKIHFQRSENNFYELCVNGKSKLFGIYKKGSPVGYLVSGRNGDNITEIVTESVDITFEAIYAFASRGNDKVTINLSPLEVELCRKLGHICEASEIKGQHSWSIYNWESVISAFMSVKNSVETLKDGKVVLGIKEYGNLNISVSNGAAECSRTNEPAFLELEPAVAARLIFGLMPPSLVLDIPKSASILNDWFPLPLYLSSQDFA